MEDKEVYMHIIDALKTYFEGEQPFSDLGVASLEAYYNWKIPSVLFDGCLNHYSGSNFEANVALKKDLSQRWKNEPYSREEITKWVISDWGGIRGNRKSTLNNYYLQSLQSSPKTPLKGIASFSKVLAVKDSKKYAIYDARVAVSINAIQIIAKTDKGIAFPYLAGRNNITGNSTSKPRRGFSTMNEVAIKTLTSKPTSWTKVQKDEAYEIYINLLQKVSTDLRIPVCNLEMALFSQAEELACRIFPRLRKI
jgi:hypothetical protein